jgi:hypothetical protein
MTEDMNGIKTEATTNKDTISQLLDDRDHARNRDGRDRSDDDHPKREESGEASPKRTLEKAAGESLKPEQPKREKVASSETGKNLKEDDGDGSKDDTLPSSASAEGSLSEFEALRTKLEKTEKVLAENQRYGRTNAQKVKNAQKVVQKFADEGLLTEEEAKELFGTLQADGREPPPNGDGSEDDGMPRRAVHPFAPIFKVANKELQNILKYTDDDLLQDKVNAFDYFLSVGSKEEVGHVLEELTELLDDPVKLAKKMLSIGQVVFEESYKHIQEAGGFKNYLSKKDQDLEKLQKKIDKLEKKLLQYEDFDQPRYRIDEMGDGADGEPAKDTITTLFEVRDGRSAGRPLSRFGG